jgi:hypothetical protein
MRKIVISAAMGLALTIARFGRQSSGRSQRICRRGRISRHPGSDVRAAGRDLAGSGRPAERLVQRLVQRPRQTALHGYPERQGSRTRADRVLQGQPSAPHYTGDRYRVQKYERKTRHQGAVKAEQGQLKAACCLINPEDHSKVNGQALTHIDITDDLTWFQLPDIHCRFEITRSTMLR